MKPQLNHIIVAAHDKHTSADFLAEILGLDVPITWGHFAQVETGNGVGIDFVDADEVHSMHLAFLVTEAEFDEIFGRIQAAGIEYWADPMRSRPGEINTNDGGRGVYFPDPSGNFLEILTRPYGSGPKSA
ncbi:MAG: VOC family protein [Acidimicrobiales bacterium]|nr:VOC family protein [Acidimicrobiales bacterium]